jgi:hypothetical protein
MITDIPSVWGGHLNVRVLATAGEYVLLRCALDEIEFRHGTFEAALVKQRVSKSVLCRTITLGCSVA